MPSELDLRLVGEIQANLAPVSARLSRTAAGFAPDAILVAGDPPAGVPLAIAQALSLNADQSRVLLQPSKLLCQSSPEAFHGDLAGDGLEHDPDALELMPWN